MVSQVVGKNQQEPQIPPPHPTPCAHQTHQPRPDKPNKWLSPQIIQYSFKWQIFANH